MREGKTAIVRKYRKLVRTLKQTWVEQVILSGILPVIGRRGHYGYSDANRDERDEEGKSTWYR